MPSDEAARQWQQANPSGEYIVRVLATFLTMPHDSSIALGFRELQLLRPDADATAVPGDVLFRLTAAPEVVPAGLEEPAFDVTGARLGDPFGKTVIAQRSELPGSALFSNGQPPNVTIIRSADASEVLTLFRLPAGAPERVTTIGRHIVFPGAAGVTLDQVTGLLTGKYGKPQEAWREGTSQLYAWVRAPGGAAACPAEQLRMVAASLKPYEGSFNDNWGGPGDGSFYGDAGAAGPVGFVPSAALQGAEACIEELVVRADLREDGAVGSLFTVLLSPAWIPAIDAARRATQTPDTDAEAADGDTPAPDAETPAAPLRF
jgi:hypothetical protein